jgi:hypothetical protein
VCARTNAAKAAAKALAEEQKRAAKADQNPSDQEANPENTPENPSEKGTSMSEAEAIQARGDMSLQAWGKELAKLEGAADHVAHLYAQAEAAAEAYKSAINNLRTLGETELPASHTLMADVETTANKAGGASNAAAWRSVSAEAAALPVLYRNEHETDEDRLHRPRKGLEAEKRADVSYASQDN